METLKEILDKYTLKNVEQELNTFVYSAKGYPDVLKLTFALMTLMRQAVDLFSQQDLSSYPDIVRKKLEDERDVAKQCIDQHSDRFDADGDLMQILGLCDDETIKKLSSEIDGNLKQCEQIMNQLVKTLETYSTKQLSESAAASSANKL